MEIHQLRYFVAAAEAGSVSRAASRCHVAQPSLSQQLKKLELYLGIDLFDRLGRGVILTEAGKAFLPRARRILSEIKDAESNIRKDLQEGTGRITIGAIPTMAPYLLPKAISSLRKQHKNTEISIVENFTENLVEALVDNEIDLAIVSTPIDNDLIELEVLEKDELLIVVPESYNTSKHSELSLSELRDEQLVVLEDLHCLGTQIENFCNSKHVTPRIICKTTQLSTIFKLVSLGVGISIVPEMAAADSMKNGCKFMRLKQGRPFREVAVAWRKDRTKALMALEFAQYLKNNLDSGLYKL